MVNLSFVFSDTLNVFLDKIYQFPKVTFVFTLGSTKKFETYFFSDTLNYFENVW